MANKPKTVAVGFRILEEVNTWLKRASAKSGKSRNELVAEILTAAYNARHAK